MDTLIALGTTDEHTVCGCCGRVNLKETLVMAIRDADGEVSDAVAYYGVVCGARAAGRPVPELRREARDGNEAARKALAQERARLAAATYARCEAWWTAKYGTADRDVIAKQTGLSPFAVWQEANAATAE